MSRIYKHIEIIQDIEECFCITLDFYNSKSYHGKDFLEIVGKIYIVGECRTLAGIAITVNFPFSQKDLAIYIKTTTNKYINVKYLAPALGILNNIKPHILEYIKKEAQNVRI